MNFKIIAGAVGALSLLAGAAQAATVYNADLAGPGFYSGTGIDNGHFAVNTVDGIELGLRARQGPPNPLQAVAPVAANLYQVVLGENISIDFSFNPGADGTPVSLAGLTSTLTITNLGTGGIASFNPLFLPDNDTDPGAPGGFQNSERLSFGFLNGAPAFNVGNINYNNLVNSSYRVDFSVSGADFATISNTIFVNQGSGAVPEPATWGLMIGGFGLAGAMLRRRRAVVA